MMARQKELLDAQNIIKQLEEQLKETQAAKDELEASRRELEEMMQRLEESKSMEAEERARLEEEIKAKQEEVAHIYQEATAALMAATTPAHQHVADHELDEDENEGMPNGNGDTSKDLRTTDDDIADPINERLTLADRNERLQNQLRSLKEVLSHTRDETGETTMDRIHKENVKQGRDKYKTLREVRKGNTKRRVDQFENM